MDLLNIIHNVKTTCEECKTRVSFDELLVSDSGRINSEGKSIYYIVGIMGSPSSYAGEKARCPNCGKLLDWIIGKLVIQDGSIADDSEIIQSVKEWLNNQ